MKKIFAVLALTAFVQSCGFKSVVEHQGCENSGIVGSDAYDNRADAENYRKGPDTRAASPSASAATKRVAETVLYGLYTATSRSDAYQKGWAMCMDAHDYF